MEMFNFQEFWWAYLGFLGFISVILLLDLGVFNKEPHVPSFKEAGSWTIVWISVALIFNVAFYFYSIARFTDNPGLVPEGFTAHSLATKLSLEFLTGYVVEKTLAIDNIFVFALVFSFFKVSPKYQHKVLFWGILGAVFFRGLFIAVGSYLMQFHMMVVFFGIFLIFTGMKLPFQKDDGDVGDKFVIRLIKKFVAIKPDDDKGSFTIRENGKLFVTPLFLALIVIEVSDVIFAVDSVPAIFALTNEPFIVFTSNIMAILGLRSMYFLMSGFLDKFYYIKYGLSSVLIFVGLKMCYFNGTTAPKIPVLISLTIIFVFISSSILFSLIKKKEVAIR